MNEAIEGIESYTIKCQHCGEEALVTPLNWRTIEYGFILLSGVEDGYIGVTCPNPECLHTSLVKEGLNTLNALRKELFSEAEYGPGWAKPLLRYRSFPYGFAYPHEMCEYQLDFHFSKITDGHQYMIEAEVIHILANTNRKDFSGLYMPYFFEDLAMAPGVCVRLYLQEGIEKIAAYENEKRTKLFPRYMPYDSAIEEIDAFCFFHLMQEPAIEKLQESMPGMSIIYADGSTKAKREANRIHAFFEVLTTPAGQTRKRYESLSSGSEDLDETTSADSIEHEVSVKYSKGLGKDFLEKNWLRFGLEYISTSDKVGFTAHKAETLRKKYLALLDKEMDIEILATKQYAFYEEPPTWTIIFDGKPIRSLKGEGFKLIHYLVSCKGQKVSLFELAVHAGFSSDNPPADKEDIPEFESDDYTEETEQHSVGLDRILDHRDGSPEIADDQYKHQAKQRIIELEEELRAAKKTNDKKKIEKTTSELDLFRKFYMEIIKPGGGLQNFKNETDRIKDRIGKEITRAIDQLAKANERAGKHFKEAFRKRYTLYHCYDPRENIKWSLD